MQFWSWHISSQKTGRLYGFYLTSLALKAFHALTPIYFYSFIPAKTLPYIQTDRQTYTYFLFCTPIKICYTEVLINAWLIFYFCTNSQGCTTAKSSQEIAKEWMNRMGGILLYFYIHILAFFRVHSKQAFFKK